MDSYYCHHTLILNKLNRAYKVLNPTQKEKNTVHYLLFEIITISIKTIIS